jgi:hypothetical protein
MLVQRLGKPLKRRMQRLYGGRWFGFLLLFLSGLYLMAYYEG